MIVNNKCPECGFENEGPVCINCGTELAGESQPQKMCPSCSAAITPGKRFCLSCGCEQEGSNVSPVTVKTVPVPAVKKEVQVAGRTAGQTPLIAMVIILVGVITGLVFFLLVKPGRGDVHEELSVCEGNLKSLASACVMYATENNGHYPGSLDELLEKKYISQIPVCPACQKPYIYSFQTGPDFFLIKCGGINAHLKTGSVSEGHYPVYNPQDRLVLTGDYKTSITPTSIPEPTAVPVEIAKNSSPKNSPVSLLKENYKALTNRDFKKAYNFRSKRYKSEEMSYSQFYENWKINETIRLEYTEVMYETEEKAKVKITLYSEDNDGSGVKGAYYSGACYLLNEDGSWKIDKVDVQEDYNFTGSRSDGSKPHKISENCGIIPNSQYRYLNKSDLAGLSVWQLNIVRNEIYARHGRPFENSKYRNYFEKQWWYDENPAYQDWWISEMETANAAFIKDYQDKTGLK